MSPEPRDIVRAGETRGGPGLSSCSHVLEIIKSQYEFKLKEENRKITLNVERRAQIYVRMLPIALELILEDLVKNAQEHGDGDIHLSAEIAGEYARVVVEDEGPGIPTHERDKIFERSVGKGSGEGLYIVKRDVEGAGGEVKATDKEGARGARIEVMLPLAT